MLYIVRIVVQCVGRIQFSKVYPCATYSNHCFKGLNTTDSFNNRGGGTFFFVAYGLIHTHRCKILRLHTKEEMISHSNVYLESRLIGNYAITLALFLYYFCSHYSSYSIPITFLFQK